MGKRYRKKHQGRRRIKLSEETPKRFISRGAYFWAKRSRKHGQDKPGHKLYESITLAVKSIEEEMSDVMQKLCVAPQIIHAFKQTGRIVTESNKHLLSKAELAQWDAAIDEYYMEKDKRSA